MSRCKVVQAQRSTPPKSSKASYLLVGLTKLSSVSGPIYKHMYILSFN